MLCVGSRKVEVLLACGAIALATSCAPTDAPQQSVSATTAPAATPPAHTPDFETVELQGTRAIIVPSGEVPTFGQTIDAYWSPTASDVLRAHTRIREELRTASTAPDRFFASPPADDRRAWQLDEIGKILALLDEETMQCAGVVIDGHRRLMCNFFPHGNDGVGLRTWVGVEDGGCVFWQVQYDFDSDECLQFSSNGYA